MELDSFEQRFEGGSETVEVKMSSSPIRKSIASVQLHENNSRLSAQPEQLIRKKMPHSEKPSDEEFHESSDTLDDVSFLRLPEVKAVTGLSKTSIYELVRSKSFPAPVRLGPRAVAWVRSEVRQWALERVHASRSVA
jgi:predicted DNA-binding transcriptional regulator AlpA